jgi:hypothetical protein
MANLQGSKLAAISVFGAQIPGAGPQAVPVPMDFSQSASYFLDFSNEINKGRLQICQTVFIDASGVTNPFTITFDGSGQTISVPGGTQGYYSVCAPNPLKMTMSCAGMTGGPPAPVLVLLLNYPVANSQWLAA